MGTTQTKSDKTRDVCYFDDGNMKCEKWYKDNICHRDGDEPAVIDYYEDRKIKAQWWCKNGYNHRDTDLPALIDYYEDGEIKTQRWYQHGYIHRENGPARIEILKNTKFDIETGKICQSNGDIYRIEYWYKNGQNWDCDGPVVIHYNNNIKIREVWYKRVYMNQGKIERFKKWSNLMHLELENVDYFPDGKPKREIFVVE